MSPITNLASPMGVQIHYLVNEAFEKNVLDLFGLEQRGMDGVIVNQLVQVVNQLRNTTN